MINWIARLLLPHLRRVDPDVLRQMKRELTYYNSREKRWSEQATPISADIHA